jgi:hypothetical protein
MGELLTGPAVTPVKVPLTIVLVQLYVEPLTFIEGVKLNAPPPLHMVVDKTELVIDGIGLTVATIVKGAPTQKVTPGPVGIIVYVTS